MVPAGNASWTVTDSRVTPQSHIGVTLTSDPPRRGIAVSWAQRSNGSFIIHLTGISQDETDFTYIVVNSP